MKTAWPIQDISREYVEQLARDLGIYALVYDPGRGYDRQYRFSSVPATYDSVCGIQQMTIYSGEREATAFLRGIAWERDETDLKSKGEINACLYDQD